MKQILSSQCLSDPITWLYSFLSWRGFTPIARLSYPINMLHFRIMMEIAYRDITRTALADLAGGGGSYRAFLPGSFAGPAAVGVQLWVAGRDLHLSTSQLNLSRSCH